MSHPVKDPGLRGRLSEEVFEVILKQVLALFEERHKGEFVVRSINRTSGSNRLRKFDFSGIDFIVKYQYREKSFIALFQVKSSDHGVRVFKEKNAHYMKMICVINMSPKRTVQDLMSEVESYIRWTHVNHIDLQPFLERIQKQSSGNVNMLGGERKVRAVFKKRLSFIKTSEDYYEANDDLNQYYDGESSD